MIQQTLQETFEDSLFYFGWLELSHKTGIGWGGVFGFREIFKKKFGIFNFSEKVLLCSRTSLEEIFISLKA